MLGTTLWLVVAIGLFATALLDAASSFGRAGTHAAADHALEAAMHDAVADYQNRLQSALAQTPPSSAAAPDRYAIAISTLPNPLERTYQPEATGATNAASSATNVTGAAAVAPGTEFTLAYDVFPTTITAPSCVSGSGSDQAAPDAIGWLQCNGFVAESRMSLRVVVRVLDASGNATLAQREQFVTLRLFGEPPYSAIAGRKDSAAADVIGPVTSTGSGSAVGTGIGSDAPASPAHEGDIAGDTLSGVSPAPLASPWPAGGTLIHVRYECHDGTGSCANAAPPDPDADLRAGSRWSNGNRPTP